MLYLEMDACESVLFRCNLVLASKEFMVFAVRILAEINYLDDLGKKKIIVVSPVVTSV